MSAFDGPAKAGPHREHDDAFRLGYLARIAPEKGLHLLVDAFVRLRRKTGETRLRLEAAGYLAPANRPYLAEVERSLARAGLAQDFTYHGAVDRARKLQFLRRLDVLSMPATYDEPKGLPLLEAMACGVPVVQPRRGAFTEIVETTGGGLLVEPDDPERLAEGLLTLWQDDSLRRRLGRQGYDGVRKHYTIGKSVGRLIEVYEREATKRTEAAVSQRRNGATEHERSRGRATPPRSVR